MNATLPVKRSGWFWGAFFLLLALQLQVLQQAQSLGQVFREIAALPPVAFGRWFEPMFNAVILALLFGALRDYSDRADRKRHPFRLLLAMAAVIQGMHVLELAATAADGGTRPPFLGIVSRGFEPALVDFQINLILLATVVVCFVGFRARAEIPTPAALAASREAQEHASRAEAFAALGRAQRVLADMHAARVLLGEAVAHARLTGDDVVLARMLRDLGELEHARGRYVDALRLFNEVLDIEERIWQEHGLRVPLTDPAIVEETIERCATATKS